MKRQWVLLLVTTAVTVLVAIGIIRLVAPGLLGIPTDLQLVQVSKRVPPFFEGVFRKDDLTSDELLVQDPTTVMRGRPLFENHYGMGPHDLLGFRNRSVPYTADVVTIGDSQTYGNNAPLEENWPSRLKAYLPAPTPIVYNMSCGAWTGPHYLEILSKAMHLRPRVVVVAFYSGNDPLAAFTSAHGSERWDELRQNRDLSKEDRPKVNWPPPPEEQWAMRFRDGSTTVFTPQLRYGSNIRGDLAVQEGWSILLESARRMTSIARDGNAGIVFTVIPTKELVLAKKVEAESIEVPEVYSMLVRSELEYIAAFDREIGAIPGARFVDMVVPLQSAAGTEVLYPSDSNGHPIRGGYDVIAKAVASELKTMLPALKPGLAFLQRGSKRSIPVLIQDEGYYLFGSPRVMAENGWAVPREFQVLGERDLATRPYLGTIDYVDRKRFGPGAARG
jgi:lysophospholipase L1-like esterase